MTVTHQDFITNARTYVKTAWDAISALQDMQLQWNALDYGNTLENGTGLNSGITSQQVGSAIFAGGDALMAVLEGGNGGNLAKLL